MPTYIVSSTHFFRENGERVEAGDTIELTEKQAEEHNAAHPGLLKEARKTTVAKPTAVREKPRGRPKSRAKK